jgi:hypothetical protein
VVEISYAFIFYSNHNLNENLEIMINSTVSSPAQTAREPKKVSFDLVPLIKDKISFARISSTLSLLNLLYFTYGSLIRPMRKTGFIVVILCSLLTMALAATDCEILNSGISSISSSTCCIETLGIVCVNGRVTEM